MISFSGKKNIYICMFRSNGQSCPLMYPFHFIIFPFCWRMHYPLSLTLEISTLTAGFKGKMNSETLVASYIVGKKNLPEILKTSWKKKSIFWLASRFFFFSLNASYVNFIYNKNRVQASSRDSDITSFFSSLFENIAGEHRVTVTTKKDHSSSLLFFYKA